jgi:hypothetical protein
MCLNPKKETVLGVIYINSKLKLTQNMSEPEKF